MRFRATIPGALAALAAALLAAPSHADTAPRVQLAELCTIDAVPAGRGTGGKFKRREKPPDYLLPKKEETEEQQQSAPAAPTAVSAPGDTTAKLTELKAIFDKGLIGEGEYEATQLRILAEISPASTGVESGLRMLRQLWDQSLITPSPYAAKRKELLDAL